MIEAKDLEELEQTYRDLHQHPELSRQEHRTAALAADQLTRLGFEVIKGIGGTGVVGVLSNGSGPTALLRADMDALPVQEQTGLPYASTDRGTDRDGHDCPVMHACGHDMHVACLLGAARRLSRDRDSWRGTTVLVFQPAEEQGSGARAMIDDGLYERVRIPDVVLGQHVAPFPAGHVALRSGAAFAAADALRIVLYGTGGHGSRPETTVDSVLLAAATVMRLHTIVSREVAGGESAVVTVGALRAGTKANIIAEQAELLLSMRSYDPAVRMRIMQSIDRIVRAEAWAAGSPREPEIAVTESFPMVVNDPPATERTRAAFVTRFGDALVHDPGPVTGSEDVGEFATAAGCPCVYWLLGGADPALFGGAADTAAVARVAGGLPSNHSPRFAPLIQPTLTAGIDALVTAAGSWLSLNATG